MKFIWFHTRRAWGIFWLIFSPISVAAAYIIYFAGWISGDTEKQLAAAYERIVSILPILKPALEEPAFCVALASLVLGVYLVLSDFGCNAARMNRRHRTP